MIVGTEKVNIKHLAETTGVVSASTAFTRIRLLRDSGFSLSMDLINKAVSTPKGQWGIPGRFDYKPSQDAWCGIEPFSTPCKTCGLMMN